MSMLTDFLNLN